MTELTNEDKLAQGLASLRSAERTMLIVTALLFAIGAAMLLELGPFAGRTTLGFILAAIAVFQFCVTKFLMMPKFRQQLRDGLK